MDRDELKAKLEEVLTRIAEEFNGPAAIDRIQQLSSHISTSKMVIDHIFDESERMEGYKA